MSNRAGTWTRHPEPVGRRPVTRSRTATERPEMPTSLTPGLVRRQASVGQHRLFQHLQTVAGNTAMGVLLQRDGGWPDASKKGKAWNDAKAKAVGKIWRIAIAGLKGGAARAFKGGDSAHTTEGADHRAIVLVPDGFKPGLPTDVLLFFHGHTETWRGKYAGLRQRSFTPTKATADAKLTSDDKVRDVHLDQIENQIESSGKRQTIGILAQGGPQHQFGEINVDAYIGDVLTRTNKEYPSKLTAVPKTWSVILSGHSGGGFAVQDALSDKNKPKNLKGLILFDAEAMDDDMRTRITKDLKFLADLSHTDSDRDTYLAAQPSVRAFTTAGSTYATRYKDIVTATITATTNKIFPRYLRNEHSGLRKRHDNQPLTGPEKDRLKELQAKRPRDPAGRNELKQLKERNDSRALSARETRRMTDLTKQELPLLAVTKFLPKIQERYQLTALPDGVSHEEIIRGTPEGSGDYKPGQGNLENALRSMP
jgi:hypothetical protein